MEKESQKEKGARCKWESDSYCTKKDVIERPYQICDYQIFDDPKDCPDFEALEEND